MNRLLAVTTALILCPGAWVKAAAQPRVAFEVVSIKPAPAPTPALFRESGYRPSFNVDAAGVRIVGYDLTTLLTTAFRIQAAQLDTPRFTRDEYFGVEATLPAGATPAQVPEMLQTMLVERFKLAYHRETREYQATVVTVGKGGMKLPRLPDGTPRSSSQKTLPDGSVQRTEVGKLASFFAEMASLGGMRLVDETGMDGVYTWVEMRPEYTAGANYQEYQDRLQESFKAMIEAAGLKLETRKATEERIVVDHLEKMPTDN